MEKRNTKLNTRSHKSGSSYHQRIETALVPRWGALFEQEYNSTSSQWGKKKKKKKEKPPRKQNCSHVLITSSLSSLPSGRSLHCSCLDWDKTPRKYICWQGGSRTHLHQTENTFINYCHYLEVNAKNQEEHQVLKILQVTNWTKIPLQLQELGSRLTIFANGKSYSLPQQMFSSYR